VSEMAGKQSAALQWSFHKRRTVGKVIKRKKLVLDNGGKVPRCQMSWCLPASYGPALDLAESFAAVGKPTAL
jgi:hypothetical protein